MTEHTDMDNIFNYVFGEDGDEPTKPGNKHILFVLREMERRNETRYDKLSAVLFGTDDKPGLKDRVKKLEWILKPAQLITAGILGGAGMYLLNWIITGSP